MKFETVFLFFVLSSLGGISYAQEVTVYFQKDLHFGEFYLNGNSGGTICISNTGRISPSGNINLLGSEYQPATLLVSTSSEQYLEVQIEANAKSLTSKEGGNLRLRLNEPDRTYYHIKKGIPVEINLGGCLEIEPGGAISSAEHFGKIQVNVIILNK